MQYIIILVIIIVSILYVNSQQVKDLKRENRVVMKSVQKLQVENQRLNMRPMTIIKKIKPKKIQKIQYEKRHRFIRIFSQDRDKVLFPRAAEFEYKLPSKIKNIESVELSKFVMTRSQRVVDKHNDTMLILDVTTQTKYTIKMPHGDYSISSYISQMNAFFLTNEMDIRFEFDNIAHTVTLKNLGYDTEYKILYTTEERENSNFNLIGFECEDFTLLPGVLNVSVGETKTGAGRVDMFGATNIMVQAKEISYGYDDVTISNVNVSSGVVNSYENGNDRPRRVISPLLKLTKLSLKVTFQPAYKERRLYEFNGIEYSLVLEVVTLEQKMPFDQIRT
jgi:hypothetical protein